MPDARTIIEGRVASDVRFGEAGGAPVANVRVLAGRSKKNDTTGQWETLSTTAYDVAFWRNHHDLIAGLGVGKGDSVTITGTIGGVESYQGQSGESLSVKVTGHGIQHFPKQDRAGGGFGQPQQQYRRSPQGEQYNPQAAPQQQAGWPQTAQPGQGFDGPPF